MNKSTLSIVVGPMYSNKTTWLIDNLNKCYFLGLKVLFINSIKDKRKLEEGNFSTHNPSYKKFPESIDFKSVTSLKEVDVDLYDVIGIDECQWVEDLIIIKEWLEKGKNVYCCGLDGDFNRKPFIKDLIELIPLCSYFKKKTALCKLCMPNLVEASFTKIIVEVPKEGNYVNDCKNDSFIPVCNSHYL